MNSRERLGEDDRYFWDLIGSSRNLNVGLYPRRSEMSRGVLEYTNQIDAWWQSRCGDGSLPDMMTDVFEGKSRYCWLGAKNGINVAISRVDGVGGLTKVVLRGVGSRVESFNRKMDVALGEFTNEIGSWPGVDVVYGLNTKNHLSHDQMLGLFTSRTDDYKCFDNPNFMSIVGGKKYASKNYFDKREVREKGIGFKGMGWIGQETRITELVSAYANKLQDDIVGGIKSSWKMSDGLLKEFLRVAGIKNREEKEFWKIFFDRWGYAAAIERSMMYRSFYEDYAALLSKQEWLEYTNRNKRTSLY